MIDNHLRNKGKVSWRSCQRTGCNRPRLSESEKWRKDFSIFLSMCFPPRREAAQKASLDILKEMEDCGSGRHVPEYYSLILRQAAHLGHQQDTRQEDESRPPYICSLGQIRTKKKKNSTMLSFSYCLYVPFPTQILKIFSEFLWFSSGLTKINLFERKSIWSKRTFFSWLR